MGSCLARNAMEALMKIDNDQPPHQYSLTIDSSGRIQLPAELRRRFGIVNGDALVIVESGGSFQICTPKQLLRRGQEYFGSVVPGDISLVDELIEERRAEVFRT